MNFRRFFKFFLTTFLLIFSLCFIILTIGYNYKVGLIIGLVFGSLFGLFAAGHIERNLKRDTLEINSSNKAPTIGLHSYREEINQFLSAMRYRQSETYSNITIYTPRVNLRVMGGNIKIEQTPYYISIEAPVGVIRILSSQLEIQKIFL